MRKHSDAPPQRSQIWFRTRQKYPRQRRSLSAPIWKSDRYVSPSPALDGGIILIDTLLPNINTDHDRQHLPNKRGNEQKKPTTFSITHLFSVDEAAKVKINPATKLSAAPADDPSCTSAGANLRTRFNTRSCVPIGIQIRHTSESPLPVIISLIFPANAG